MRPLLVRLLQIVSVGAVIGCGPTHVAPPSPVDQGSFLVHRVTRHGETVRSLSKWYSGSEKPAKEIARASNVGENTALKPGQRVLIPISYAKKKTPPPKPKAAPKAPAPVQPIEPKESSEPKLDVELAVAETEQGKAPLGSAQEVANLELKVEESPPIVGPEAPTSDTTQGNPVKAEPPASPSANANKVKPVESFEELLLKEQTEVEKLRQEMLNAPAADAQN